MQSCPSKWIRTSGLKLMLPQLAPACPTASPHITNNCPGSVTGCRETPPIVGVERPPPNPLPRAPPPFWGLRSPSPRSRRSVDTVHCLNRVRVQSGDTFAFSLLDVYSPNNDRCSFGEKLSYPSNVRDYMAVLITFGNSIVSGDAPLWSPCSVFCCQSQSQTLPNVMACCQRCAQGAQVGCNLAPASGSEHQV